MHADVERSRSPTAHVRRRAAADGGQLETRQARAGAGHRAEVQELRPRSLVQPRLVVDEEALAPRRPARRHRPVGAQVELVVAQPLDVAQQRVAAQARVAHQLVEALHHRRLAQRGQRRGADGGVIAGQGFAVVRRMAHRVAHQVGQPLALARLAAFDRPALTLGQRAGVAQRLCDDGQSPHPPRHRLAPFTRWSRTRRAMRVPMSASTACGRTSRSSVSPSVIAVIARWTWRGSIAGCAPWSSAWRSSASDERALEARVDGREALAQRRPADHVRPELEEGRQPAIIAPAAAARVRDHATRSSPPGPGGGERPLELEGSRALHASLVDGEEEVLLGREVRVHRALRVAGGVRRSDRPRWRGSPARRRAGRAAATPPRACAAAARRVSFAYRWYLYTSGI